jgi:hypothetical protein
MGNMGGSFAGSNNMMGGGMGSNPRASPMGQQYDAFSGLGASGSAAGRGSGNQYGGNRPMSQQQQQQQGQQWR